MEIVLCVVCILMGAYAYGNNAVSIFRGTMDTSFWGRLIWLGTNTVVLLSLFGGEASIYTKIPMINNVCFMLLIQIACAYRKLFKITKTDIVCLIIVAIGLSLYLFVNPIVGLIITLLADTIGGILVMKGMFSSQKSNGKPENRRQYIIGAVRNIIMLIVNGPNTTFLAVFGLAYQATEAIILTTVAHITKKRH